MFLAFCILPFLFAFNLACPDGAFVGLNKSICYDVLVKSTGISWYDAETHCETHNNGHLASISNAFTNSFITSYLNKTQLNNQYWIGGTSTMNEEGHWSWSDGSDFNYTNWESGDPSHGTVFCIILSVPDGLWSSIDCSFSGYTFFLCEFLNTDKF